MSNLQTYTYIKKSLDAKYNYIHHQSLLWIEQISGRIWTDYNVHDPGITILEALCYAITDLSYRLSFEIEDLLLQPKKNFDSSHQFLTAREIFTVNPLTINDYRKLLIDIEGIKNAKFKPIKTSEPQLYYEPDKGELGLVNTDNTKPLNLGGLYRVLLEPAADYKGKLSDLEKTVRKTLNQHRNLCEDFDEIRILNFEDITIHVELELDPKITPDSLLKPIFNILAQYISPSFPFQPLQDLIEQGKPVEEIFLGPALTHGFIDDEHLQKWTRRTKLHTSDLTGLLLDISGVKAIQQITLISNQQSEPHNWALNIQPDYTPRLTTLKLTTTTNGIRHYEGELQSNDPALEQKSEHHIIPLQNIPLPQGSDRHLGDSTSIQTEFPTNYGIGNLGLPSSASPERKAQAKQLQAYLMVFDQLLANLFEQLAQVQNLFGLDSDQMKTYFSQNISHFPGGQDLLQAEYAAYIDSCQSSAVNLGTEEDRKNRLLDHLLAQYGETYITYPLHSLIYPNSEMKNFLEHKTDCARNIPRSNGKRGQAFDYTISPNQINGRHNTSGLKQRVEALLGIDRNKEPNIPEFYIIEHLLLRPRLTEHPISSTSNGEELDSSQQNTTQSKALFSFAQPITTFEKSNTPNRVICRSHGHNLRLNDEIKIFYSAHYDGTHTVLQATKDSFEIEHQFFGLDTAYWFKTNQFEDPFSFQISVIFPEKLLPTQKQDLSESLDLIEALDKDEIFQNILTQLTENPLDELLSVDLSSILPERLLPGKEPTTPTPAVSSALKQLIQNTFIEEIPAHITVYLHWFDEVKMAEFQTVYPKWQQELSDLTTEQKETEIDKLIYRDKLVELLGIGSGKIPMLPKRIGYMTIGTTFEVS